MHGGAVVSALTSQWEDPGQNLRAVCMIPMIPCVGFLPQAECQPAQDVPHPRPTVRLRQHCDPKGDIAS